MFDEVEPFIRQINPNEVWKYQYPVTPSYVPSKYLWMLIFITPLSIFLIEFAVVKNWNDQKSAAWALSLSYSLNGFLTTYLKVIVGRPRPDFYYRCFPSGTGTDFNKCTGVREQYMDGRKSFPSGHSSFAFSGMVFLSLYLARKLNFLKDVKSGQSLIMCACLFPILVSTSIAISRTCDYHHHNEGLIKY